MAVLDKKVQLAILDKVAECSDENPVMIDSLTIREQFNFKYLDDKHCLNRKCDRQYGADGYPQDIMIGATGLTERGQEFRMKLIEELEIIELRRQSVKAFEEGNRKAETANRIAWWAIGLSVFAILTAAVLPIILQALGCVP